jgi:hypothetical protein
MADFNPISEKESKDFLALSNLMETAKFEEALQMAKGMLEEYPQNMHVYHNQIGALEFMVSFDYLLASKHYYIALENGFDIDTCEDNIWEAAEELYKSLQTEDGKFNAIINTETQGFFHATGLIERYLEKFPNGKYINEANKYLEEYKKNR